MVLKPVFFSFLRQSSWSHRKHPSTVLVSAQFELFTAAFLLLPMAAATLYWFFPLLTLKAEGGGKNPRWLNTNTSQDTTVGA